MKKNIKNIGFSLLEIIIVMVIISIATLGIMMSVGINDSKRNAQESAEILKELMIFVQNKAILTQKNYGLITYSDGYLFVEQQDNLQWKVTNDDVILKRKFLSSNLKFKLDATQVQSRIEKILKPEIYIYSDGYTDQFEIIFFSSQGKQLIILKNSAQGEMSIHE